jgi:hypothetical protein
MTVHPGPLLAGSDPGEKRSERRIHHPVTIGRGIGLRPQEIADVGVELRGAFEQVGQIRVFEPLLELLGQVLRRFDVH